ncbi:Aldehyde dehydrogenase 8 member A1 [Terramyces sp. JEL0728]|nr:Aldehyde dehydrogenase 8 member A1 [Terramyces sp. JEL0728]
MNLTNFIDGQFVEPVERNYLDNINPATGAVYGQIPNSTSKDVELAVKSANTAFETWSETTRSYRSSTMMKIADIIESRLEEFAVAESKDQGKPVSLARNVDIPRAIYNFRFFANSILNQTQAHSELDGVAYSYVLKEPVGVAALISPWNLPLYLLTWKIAPCIAFGCTCVCKPSEFTSVTAWMLCQAFQEAGLPKGVVNMIFGTGASAGSPLINHDDVPLLSFTGGTVTGELIYKAAAGKNKKVSLELGGKNANIIFADCNFEEALDTSIRSSFSNQGEICLCGSRIFVQEEIYEKFLVEFTKKAEQLSVGDPSDPNTNLGPVVSQPHLEKILYYIDIARKEGAKILTGGARITTESLKSGFFVRPTVITNVHPTESRCQKEEIFGPVVTITPFKSEEEAIKFANSTQYGLSSSIWTENGRKANRVARKLKVGTVWVNTWMTRDLNMPFGGVKNSGLGREGKDDSAHFFCEDKTICIKH